MPVEKTKDFSCEECGKHFRDKLRLSTHMKRNHTLILKKCELCHKEFKRSDHLKAHMSKKHKPQEEEKNNSSSLSSRKKLVKTKTKIVIGGNSEPDNSKTNNISDNNDVVENSIETSNETSKKANNDVSISRGKKSKKTQKTNSEKRGGRLFTPEQMKHLKSSYLGSKYSTLEERNKISKLSGLSEQSIRLWFERQRHRDKVQVQGIKSEDFHSTPNAPPNTPNNIDNVKSKLPKITTLVTESKDGKKLKKRLRDKLQLQGINSEDFNSSTPNAPPNTPNNIDNIKSKLPKDTSTPVSTESKDGKRLRKRDRDKIQLQEKLIDNLKLKFKSKIKSENFNSTPNAPPNTPNDIGSNVKPKLPKNTSTPVSTESKDGKKLQRRELQHALDSLITGWSTVNPELHLTDSEDEEIDDDEESALAVTNETTNDGHIPDTKAVSEQDKFDNKNNFNESRIISATMEEETDFLDRYENLEDEDHEGDAATNFTKPKDDPEIMDFINEVENKTMEKFNGLVDDQDQKTRRSSRFKPDEEEQKFTCESCDVSFSESESFENHLKLHQVFGIKVATTTDEIKEPKLEDVEPVVSSKKLKKNVKNKAKKLKKKLVHAEEANKEPKILLPVDNDPTNELNMKESIGITNKSKNEIKISSRSIFNSEQIQHMKASYLVNRFASPEELKKLSEITKRTEEQIKGWFKYERKKEKKNVKNKVAVKLSNTLEYIEDISSCSSSKNLGDGKGSNADDFSGNSVDITSNSITKPILEATNTSTTRRGSERKRKFSEVDDNSMSSNNTPTTNEPLKNISAEKKSRFAFTENQIQHLKAYYHKTSKYVSKKEKLKLSETLNIPEKQIFLWFQNRRQNESVKQQKNVDEIELVQANLGSYSTEASDVEISENVANNDKENNPPPEILIKEEPLDIPTLMLEDNLGRDTEIEKIARTCNQNRRQKNKPRKNNDLSNVGTVFKSLRKRHSSIGPAASPNTPTVPVPSKKQKKRTASLIAKESVPKTAPTAAKEFVFTLPKQVSKLEKSKKTRENNSKFVKKLFEIEQLKKLGNYPEDKVQIYKSEQNKRKLLQKQLKMNFEFNNKIDQVIEEDENDNNFTEDRELNNRFTEIFGLKTFTVITKTGIRMFSCDKCEEVFEHTLSLHTHKYTEHGV